MEIIRGINAVNHLLEERQREIYKVYIDKSKADKILKKLSSVEQRLISQVDKHYLDKLSHYTSHQGVVAKVSKYRYKNFESFMNEELLVVCDHLEDPHNLGAIIRSCEAMGVNTVIINADRAAQINDTVVKTSVGTTEKVNVCQIKNTNRALKKLKENGYWIVGTDLNTEQFYNEVSYPNKIALVVGNEGKGLSKNTLKDCDFVVKIPMYGVTNSLNVSVATALMIAKLKGM